MPKTLLSLFASALCFASYAVADPQGTEAELDAFWDAISKSAREGDFEAMKSAYHADAVIVNGIRESSSPIAEAFARWEQGLNDTRDGQMEANVEFRITRRLFDETTAHDTGIFHYTAKPSGGEWSHDYILFEALMVKRNGEWLMVMEYQKAKVSEEDWEAAAD